MRAIVVEGSGSDSRMALREVPDLAPPGAGEVRIRVVATAVNRADLLQRRGFYPGPPMDHEIPGSKIDLPKKVRALALRHALSAKAGASEITVLDSVAVSEPKTAKLRAQLGKLGLSSALIISGPELDRNFVLAARNIPDIDVLPAQGINVYDILRRKRLVLTRDAVAALSARFPADGGA